MRAVNDNLATPLRLVDGVKMWIWAEASCAHATRGLRRMGWAAWSSSCSRNAHAQEVLVQRAHSRIDQATLEKEIGDWEDACSEGRFACSLWRR